jgi:sirohydrochlorin ferrochelatase
MQRKTGVLIFTHGSRLKEGNEIMVKLVDQVRQRLGYDLIEPCFMELGKPPIPVAFFLVPGSHLREDIPFIFEQTLKKFPGVTYELSPPMMSDPTMIDFVAKHVESALAETRRK